MFHFFDLSLIPVSGFHSDFSLNGTDYLMQMSFVYHLPVVWLGQEIEIKAATRVSP